MKKSIWILMFVTNMAACGGTPAAESTGWLDDSLCVDLHDGQTILQPERYFRRINDLVYDKTNNLTGDLWLPARSKGPFPAVVHIHGGGWTGGHKGLRNAVAYGEFLACQNIALLDIDYRLAPENKISGQVADANCALRWMRAGADGYPIDGDRLMVMGGSSGGNVAGLVAMTPGDPVFERDCDDLDGDPLALLAAITVYGVMDFNGMERDRIDLDSMAKKIIGVEHPDEAEWAKWSPASYVSPASPPWLFLQGTGDMLVPWTQAVEMGAKLDEAGVYNRVELVPGAEHAFDGFFESDEGRQAFSALDEFMEHILGPREDR